MINASLLRAVVLNLDAKFRGALEESINGIFELEFLSGISELADLKFKPYVIFLGPETAGRNNLALCREIRSAYEIKDCYIVLLYPDDQAVSLKDCYEAGANEVMRIPFEHEIVKSKMLSIAAVFAAWDRLVRSNRHLESKNARMGDFNRFLASYTGAHDLWGQGLIDFLILSLNPGYIELVKRVEGLNRGLGTRKRQGPWKSFDKISSRISSRDLRQIRRLIMKSGESEIHCMIGHIQIPESPDSWILIEQENPYEADDIEFFSLYIEVLEIIFQKSEATSALIKKNIEYRTEVSNVRKIQVGRLPNFKDISGFEIATAYLPEKELSGDFIDGYYLDDDIYQLILCDVSGHGIASSWIGNEIRTLFRILSQGKSLQEVTSLVNQTMARSMEGLYYYCTAIICRINTGSGIIEYLNAGHPQALMYHSEDKVVKRIRNTCPLIGLFPDKNFQSEEILLKNGDRLLLYTDGITEASREDDMSSMEALFGEKRLIRSFEDNHDHSPRDIIHLLIGNVYEFTDYRDQEDDITVICIKKS
jgi:serine phosphatase RsbU (regulator of sigma subunit)